MLNHLTSIPVGILQTNCLVLADDNGGAWFVDPGDESDKLIQVLANAKLRLRGILLTHGHVDHIRGIAGVLAATGRDTPVFLHRADHALYQSPLNAVLPWLEPAEDLPEPNADFTPLEAAGITVIETPGHTPGGVCYYLQAAGTCCVGDTLFRGSVGRTDLPGGSSVDLLAAIQDRLLTLPADTRILSGHGPETTIAREVAANPFLS